MSTPFRGIDGLRPHEPIGAAVTVGRKGRGVVETDRFHIVLPREEAGGIRPYHPQFGAFNGAGPNARKVLRGNVVHAHVEDCFTFHLKAQVIRKPAHPDKRPMCVGDGKTAERWVGPGPGDFRNIQCPHDKCEFRQGSPPKCKPWAQLLFRLRWPEETNAALVGAGRPPLPEILVKYTTGSWNTVSKLAGFFDYFKRAAAELNVKNPKFFGIPFTMTLTRETRPSRQRGFPVVVFTPEVDPVKFFAMQAAQIAQIGAVDLPTLPLSYEEQAEDHRVITSSNPSKAPEEDGWG